MKMVESTVALIVGAGPSGLATSACLNLESVPNIVLERENCIASLWKKQTYHRLKLHLAKQFCSLPHLPHSSDTPTFMPKLDFVRYLDEYVTKFNLRPRFNRCVTSATFDEVHKKWKVAVNDIVLDQVEYYEAEFLIVASGENSKGVIPDIVGLEDFEGEVLHSSQFKTGSKYKGKEVLVVGSGNSGMEIAYDLSCFGAHTSIVVRSPFHVLNKELVYMGMVLLKFLPVSLVDALTVKIANLIFGDLSKYGIHRPAEGPFYLKAITGRSAVINVGTVNKITKGEIKVYPEVLKINKNYVAFDNGEVHQFDTIIFATGYGSTTAEWLEDNDYMIDDNGMPRRSFPNHWKGEKGIYCAGFSRRGLAGVSMDAQAIAKDISKVISSRGE